MMHTILIIYLSGKLLVYSNFASNCSGGDFKNLTNWKVLFYGEDKHISIWGFWKIFDFFRKKNFSRFWQGGPYENRGFENGLWDFSTWLQKIQFEVCLSSPSNKTFQLVKILKSDPDWFPKKLPYTITHVREYPNYPKALDVASKTPELIFFVAVDYPENLSDLHEKEIMRLI